MPATTAIPPSILSALATSLGGSANAFNGSEQRRARRIGLKARVTISPYVLGVPQRPLTVDVHDLSARGMSLLRTESMQTGQQFIVRLPRAGQASADILCTVAHCKPTRTGVYKIGAEFTCMLGAEAVASPTRADGGEMNRIKRTILD